MPRRVAISLLATEMAAPVSTRPSIVIPLTRTGICATKNSCLPLRARIFTGLRDALGGQELLESISIWVSSIVSGGDAHGKSDTAGLTADMGVLRRNGVLRDDVGHGVRGQNCPGSDKEI